MATGNPYLDAAQQTTAGNVQQAQAATAANRINQSTPYANLNYQQTGTDAQGNPIWSANQTLAAPLQSALGNIQQNVANTTQNAFNAAPYQAQTGQGFTGMEGWDKATALINQRLQPQMAQAAESNTAALANQGIVPGTQAYENAMRTFNQGQNDLRTQAQLAGSQVQNTMQGQSLAQQQANNAAQAQNFTQNYNAYNSPLQQLGAFQSGTQPGYVNPYTQATVAGPDYLGAYSTQNAQAIAAQNAANAKTANTQSGLYGLGGAALLGGGGLTNLLGTAGTAANAGTGLLGLGSALTGAAGGINNWWNNLNFGSSGGAGLTNGGVTGNAYDAFGNLTGTGNAAPAAADWASAFGGTGGIDYSDIRMKENIELIGQLPSGLNVYNFEYKPEFKDLAGHGAFTGVMAQETEKVIPKAVVTMPNGYKAVNYSLIN